MKTLVHTYAPADLRRNAVLLMDLARETPDRPARHQMLNGMRVSVTFNSESAVFSTYLGAPIGYPRPDDLKAWRLACHAYIAYELDPRQYRVQADVIYAHGFQWSAAVPVQSAAAPAPTEQEMIHAGTAHEPVPELPAVLAGQPSLV